MGEVPTTSDRSDDGVRADSQRGRHADERDAAADERESDLLAREARAQAKESLEASLRGEVLEILDAAEARDEQADARDTAAGKRDSAASLHSFLNDDEYDATLKARRSAAMDRSDAHTDRDSSAEDRSRLTECSAAEPTSEAE
jgi:hypothetical protein